MSALRGAGLGAWPGTALVAGKSGPLSEILGASPRGPACSLSPLPCGPSRRRTPGLLTFDRLWAGPGRGVADGSSLAGAPDVSAGTGEGVDLP